MTPAAVVTLNIRERDRKTQQDIRAAARKGTFLLEKTYYLQHGRYVPTSPDTLGTEISFCNRWKKWEDREKSEKEFEFLLRFFGYWVNEVTSKFNFGQQMRHAKEAPIQLGCLFGIATARGDSLEEFRAAAWDYLDTILYP